MNINSIVKFVTGLIKIKGGTDNTIIGNVTDSLKTNVTASALPTGAATSANQSTEITSLQILDDVPTAQNGAFVKGNPVMGQLDDTATTAATEDAIAVARITAQRALHTNLRNNAGTEIATSANPLRTDPTGTTTQPVSGTVTANQGTANSIANAWPQKITDGTNTAAVTSGSDLQVSPFSRTLTGSGSASALNADAIASTDANGYQSVSVQITGTYTGTLTFQGSNDNTNFFSVGAANSSAPSTSPDTTTTTTGLYYVPLTFRYFRLRMTSYTSGTATANVVYDSMTPTDLGARNTSFSVLGGQLVPTITNKFRVRYVVANVTVPAAYTTIYTRSGTGLFFGFQADFNSANVRLRCTIDGGQIFEITVVDLKLFQFNDTSTTRMQAGGFWSTTGNTVDFSSKFPIPYTSSVTIEMQRSDGTNHTMSQYMVFLTEDT